MTEAKEIVVLTALQREGAQTADEFVTSRGWYVNSWAPVFTKLRKAGLVVRNGEKRPTRHGSEAFVIQISDTGQDHLVAMGGTP